MTAQLSRERLEEIASYEIGAENYPRRAEWMQMARMLLAGMNSEPVAKVDNIGVCWYADDGVSRKPAVGAALYAAAPAPVAVPDELTREEYKRRLMEEDNFDDTYRGGWKDYRAAMLKAGHVTGWIKCRERMPEEGGRYWCYVEEQNSLGKSHYQWNCSWNGDEWSDKALTGRVTHWIPLPAAPEQEV